jgi:hypothetical protein
VNFDTKSGHGGVLTASTAVIVFLSFLGALVTARQAAQLPLLQRIDLVQHLADGKLRAVNREVTKLQSRPDGVHVTEREGPGVVWIEGTDLDEGTIELDVRGRDVPQRSFVGIPSTGAMTTRTFGSLRAFDGVRSKTSSRRGAVTATEKPRR